MIHDITDRTRYKKLLKCCSSFQNPHGIIIQKFIFVNHYPNVHANLCYFLSLGSLYIKNMCNCSTCFVLTRLYLNSTHPPIIASEISNAPPRELPKSRPLYKKALFLHDVIIVKEITWFSIKMEMKIDNNI